MTVKRGIIIASVLCMTASLRDKKEALAFKDLQYQPQWVGLRHIGVAPKQSLDFLHDQFSWEVACPQNTATKRLQA